MHLFKYLSKRAPHYVKSSCARYVKNLGYISATSLALYATYNYATIVQSEEDKNINDKKSNDKKDTTQQETNKKDKIKSSDYNKRVKDDINDSGKDPRRIHKDDQNVHDDPFYRSKRKQKPNDKPPDTTYEDLVLISGNSNKELSQEIASHLGTDLAKALVGRFTDGEVNVQVYENVRGKDVYVVQSTCTPVNEHLVELLLMISTLRRASARKITAVIPYYGYARQDRKLSSRVPIGAADVARLLETMGVDRVIAIDLHCGQIQGFFGPRVPVDNLESRVVGIDYFVENEEITDLDNLMVVSPDAGGVYRARKFQESLIAKGFKNVGLAMIIKQRAKASEIERMDLVGQVDGFDCIIIDDMIDTAGTLCQAAKELKNNGAKKVYAFAAHGLFSGPAVDRINASDLEKVVITNTIPLSPKVKETQSKKFVQLSIGVLLAETIRRIHQKESVSEIFTKKLNK